MTDRWGLLTIKYEPENEYCGSTSQLQLCRSGFKWWHQSEMAGTVYSIFFFLGTSTIFMSVISVLSSIFTFLPGDPLNSLNLSVWLLKGKDK